MMKFIDKIGYKRILIYALLLSIAYFGITLYNKTTTFIDTSIFRPDYLSFEDYQLYDYTDNSNQTDSRNIFYRYNHDYLGYDGNPSLKTSKDFSVGDNWDKFLELYGDYYAMSFSANDSDFTGQRDETYYSQHYIHKSMKVKDYDEEYLKTNIIDINKNEISVNFEMYIRGNEMAYSEKECEELMHEYYSNILPGGSIFNPNIQTYYLSFWFDNVDGEIICRSIDASRYVNDY